MKSTETDNHMKGHRARMKDKVFARSAQALSDEEVLEMLLYFSIKRRDVKPLVKSLFAEFKSFGRLTAASPKKISALQGIGSETTLLLKLLEEVSLRMAREQIYETPILSNWEAVKHYCIIRLHAQAVEQLLVLFLDKKNHLLADEILQEGTIDKTTIFPREIVKKALYHEASAIILVHNHPSQNPHPSRQDIEITHQIKNALAYVEIQLLDHLIIAGNKCVSFKSKQLI